MPNTVPTLDAYVVVDFETTGLVPTADRVIEIAAVLVEHGQITQRYHALIHHPDRPTPAKITEITGLDDAQLAHGSDERTAWRGFFRFAGERVIVAHNVLFEAGFLEAAYQRMSDGALHLTNPLLCTLTLARERLVAPHKLLDVVRAVGATVRPAHRAMPDVLMTVEVLEFLRATGPPVEPFINRVASYARYGPAWAPAHVTTYAK